MININGNLKPNLLLLFVTLVLCLSVLCVPAAAIGEKEMSLQEAIQWGLENNYDLNMIRNSIIELERSLEIINAGKSFQIDLNVTPILHFGKDGSSNQNNEYLVEFNKSSLTPTTETSLTATKQFPANLSLSTELSWEMDSLYKEDYSDLTEKINASLRINKKIYPDSWSENEKQIYSIENSLKNKLEELKWKQTEKQIEVIRDYLNIVRLQEQVDIAEERRYLAEEELERVKKQIELGEGGYQQEAEAQIALEEAKGNLLNIEQNLIRNKKSLYLILNLPENYNIVFGKDIDFIAELYLKMKNMKFEDENKEILFQKALEENYQIKNSYLEKEELVKELEWTEEEGKPKLSLSGGYQFPADWFVMVDFSVNLADGGIQQIKEEQKENNIKQKEASISYLAEQLKIEAEHLLDQDEYNLLYLNTQLMALEKEQNKMEILEKQYQQGIINKTQLINARLVIEEKEIKVEQAKDEWLIGHLQLAHFIGFLQEKI